MMLTKRAGLVVKIAAGVAAAVLVLWGLSLLRSTSRGGAAAPDADGLVTARKAGQEESAATGRRLQGGRSVPSENERDSRLSLDPEAFAAVTLALDDALDDDETERILAEAVRLKKHADPEVRSRVAFALAWIGMHGLPELTTMLTDPDPEVAEEVLDYWKTKLSQIESDADKADLLGAAAEVMADDLSDDLLFDMMMEGSFLDNEHALPLYVKLLETVTNPQHKQEVIDTLQNTMEHEDPSDNEDELKLQALEEANRLMQERQAENAG